MSKDLKINSSKDVEAFLQKVRSTPKKSTGNQGRLIFAIDATASRQPTWDTACHIQRQMFDESASVGNLSLQIAFFRGFGEFKATRWTSDSNALTRPMSKIQCLGGHTQIRKVLKHALKQNKHKPVNALVYVGDCIEEDVDDLCDLAGQMGMQGVPAFMFQEGYDPIATTGFQQIAKLSNGAHFKFDMNSASALAELLKAVAIFAVGGQKALSSYGKSKGGEVLRLSQQIK